MKIGQKIADGRKAKNLTQEQLAELMSVTRQSISRWESDLSYPDMDKISYLAEVLDVSCDYLLRDDVDEPKSVDTSKAVTRLLFGAKGKSIEISFIDDMVDIDILNSVCTVIDFDGNWIELEYTKKVKKEKELRRKLIPISSIASISFVKEA